MRNNLGRSLLALTIGLFGVASVQAQGQSDRELNPDKIVHRINPGHPTIDAPTAGGTGSLSPITSHGGPVMTTPNVYLLWYGNWNQGNGSDTPAGQQIVRDFMANVSGTPYLAINKTYTGGGNQVSGNIGALTDATITGYPNGARLSDSAVSKIVSNYISTQGQADPNGVYFVLTSSDVAETSGFCNRYCGWHTKTSILSTIVKYSFVGNANRCLAGCAAQSIGPNGNAGVDGMVSVIAHELEETLTDPQLNAWYDSSGAENADKCAWTFGGHQYQTSNGAYANMKLGSRDFLIQRNLSNVDNKCYVAAGQQ